MGSKVSLANELEDLVASLELVELNLERAQEDAEQRNRLLRLLPSTVGLIRMRLVLLRKVVVETADVGTLLDRRNQLERLHDWDDPDVLLPVSSKKSR